MNKFLLSFICLSLLSGCSGGYVARSDSEFLSRQMTRIHACFDDGIKQAISTKNFEIGSIYTRCEALTYVYDEYMMIGKSVAYKQDYLNFQRARWYSEISKRIDLIKSRLDLESKHRHQLTNKPQDSKSDPLYFYSQLKGRLRIMEASFNHCDFGAGNLQLYRQSLREYSELILFTGDLIDLELQLKHGKYVSLIKDFDQIAIKELDKSIANLFTGAKKKTSCDKVRKQFIGQDRQILDLVNNSLDTIDKSLLNHPKIQPAIKKVRARLKSLNESLDKKST